MISYSAIDLQVLLSIYENDIIPYLFCYELSDRTTLNLMFEQSQLGHLLGIQKVDHSRADLKGQLCYNEIKSGNLTFDKLKSINRKAVASHCKDKMRYFDELPYLLIKPECISYDVSDCARLTNIKMSFALYGDADKASHRLILGIDSAVVDVNDGQFSNLGQVYFPRTWMIEKKGSVSIIDNQVVVQIVKVTLQNRSTLGMNCLKN